MEDCLEEVISEELKKEVPGCIKVNFLPAIKRCLKNPPYLRSAGNLTCNKFFSILWLEWFFLNLISDNRILEYKFDTVLFNKQSEFQQIQIVETQDFGRLLILNEYANLAENDRVEYTHTLMNLPHENYSVNFFPLNYAFSPIFIVHSFLNSTIFSCLITTLPFCNVLNFHAKIETIPQCLKITQNYRIWIFEFWHFLPIFDLFKLTCLVTLFDRKL